MLQARASRKAQGRQAEIKPICSRSSAWRGEQAGNEELESRSAAHREGCGKLELPSEISLAQELRHACNPPSSDGTRQEVPCGGVQARRRY